MCGIAGVYYFDRDRFVGHDELLPMLEPLRVRGPDDHVVREGKGFGFVSTRLAVRDPRRSSGPPWSFRGRLVIFNGEIYNYRELRDALVERHGVRLETKTDGELLPHLLMRAETPTLADVRGMYAIAAYDEMAHGLRLHRDPYGEKPLHYASVRGGVVFASTVGALREHPALSGDVSSLGIADHLAYGFAPDERTILPAVRRLAAGATLACDAGNAELLAAARDRPRFPVGITEFQETLRASVSERLEADRPVGIFLSGGIDSALTASFAKEVLEEPLPAFTASFGKGDDEVAGAAETARALGLPLERVSIGSEALDFLPQLTRFAGEPLGDASCLSLHALCQEARQQGIVVALTGDGADEWFYGYDRYRFLGAYDTKELKEDGALELPDPAGTGRRLDQAWRAFRALSLGTIPYPALLRQIGARSLQGLLRSGETWELWKRIEIDRHREFLQSLEASGGPAAAAAAWDRRHYLVYDPLLKSDLASMAVGLELRTPFLDPRVTQCKSEIPSLLTRGKPLLRRLAKLRKLPRARVRGRKRGFRTPLKRWIEERGGARRWMTDDLDVLEPWIHLAPVVAWIEEQDAGRRDHAIRLYHLHSLAAYLRIFPAVAPLS